MSKVIGMLVALAMFGAMPAAALAQDSGGSGSNSNTSSGNTQTGNIDQTANGGGSNSGGGSGSGGGTNGSNGSGGDAASGNGGNAGNQAAICQQNAGRDANCSIGQSQNFGGNSFVRGANGTGFHRGTSSGVVGVRHFGVGQQNGVVSVRSVTLARTGFDAWILAVIGGVSIAGGLALLAAQRRGRLHR